MSISKYQKTDTVTLTKKRIFKTSIAFAIFLSLLIYNLFSLQFINYAHYKNKVFDQITTNSRLKAKRGNIYDSNMNLLATDKTVWRIFVSSREIKKRSKNDKKEYTEIISRGLSEALDLEYASVFTKISNSNVLDITIKKSANEDEYNKIVGFINKEGLEDMIFTEAQTSRYYPEGTLAAHVLGFTGTDLQGLYGLEYSYDDILKGTDGYYLYAKDANGNSLPNDYASFVPARDGYGIVTTIDSYLQSRLEEQLEAVRINHSVENRVTGIVMDTKTGAILAMGTSSPFDPNSPYELDAISQIKLDSSGFTPGSDEYNAFKKSLLETMWANKAVSETYEPGSTFKIVTVSSALDAGAAKVSDTFSCHGYLSVGGWNIRCHKKGGHGSGFNLGYGLQMSCNPTMMTIAERLGAEKFYEYVNAFGYFEKTGIDLPSEAGTIFHKLENIGTTELATASFGQRFKVSIIRQLTSIAAVANGGTLVTPYVVEKVIDSDGNIISQHNAAPGRQVISESVAKTVSEILEEGVSGDGGAKNAAVEGYKIAAKTGTSQKFDVLDENGNSYLRIGSTVAYSISDDGGIAVIIVVDEPTSTVKYGSVVAAPYVSAFLNDALPYLEYSKEGADSHITVSDYVGSELSEAIKNLKELGITYEVIGKGNTVLAQTPQPNEMFLKPNSKVILYTEDKKLLYSVVPDVTGLSIEKANELIINAGLNIKIKNPSLTGGATVIYQSVSAGAVLERNSIVEVEILHLDFED
ncbi:MAG: PASTA domain-containing protein [Ruminococcaceae bacterium]|nr:PASTA domain-containing protein [Oscillospiraceae bacterium]